MLRTPRQDLHWQAEEPTCQDTSAHNFFWILYQVIWNLPKIPNKSVAKLSEGQNCFQPCNQEDTRWLFHLVACMYYQNEHINLGILVSPSTLYVKFIVPSKSLLSMCGFRITLWTSHPYLFSVCERVWILALMLSCRAQ